MAAQFHYLEQWIRQHLPVGDAEWRWVNEDYDTADRVPLVAMKDGFYLATGFNGWGISNGTAAGMLIADCVRGQSNAWAKLYDDTRSYPDDFNPGGDTQSLVAGIDKIAPGEGGVIARGKEKIAVWKDGDGKPMNYRRPAPTKVARSPGTTPTDLGLSVPWLDVQS